MARATQKTMGSMRTRKTMRKTRMRMRTEKIYPSQISLETTPPT
jgi:hypothetical protein